MWPGECRGRRSPCGTACQGDSAAHPKSRLSAGKEAPGCQQEAPVTTEILAYILCRLWFRDSVLSVTGDSQQARMGRHLAAVAVKCP